MTLRETILAADDLPTKTVPVEAWGVDITLRCLPAVDIGEWQVRRSIDGAMKGRDAVMAQAELVALCAVDSDGARIFADDDIEALARKNLGALSTLFRAALDINGISRDAIEDAKKN